MRRDSLQHGLQFARGRDVVANLGQRGHFLGAVLGLGVQLGRPDGGAGVRRNRAQQPHFILAEGILAGRGLDADHADCLATRHDGHAQVRPCLLAHHLCSEFSQLIFEILIDQDRLAVCMILLVRPSPSRRGESSSPN